MNLRKLAAGVVLAVLLVGCGCSCHKGSCPTAGYSPCGCGPGPGPCGAGGPGPVVPGPVPTTSGFATIPVR